jgi:hypothetical protein
MSYFLYDVVDYQIEHDRHLPAYNPMQGELGLNCVFMNEDLIDKDYRLL